MDLSEKSNTAFVFTVTIERADFLISYCSFWHVCEQYIWFGRYDSNL